MATGPTYRVEFRRKRAQLTDYKKRLKIVKSGKTFLIIRRSNNAVQCQFAEYSEDGDKVILGATSHSLKKYGYKGHTGNIPAAYLTGYMAGLMAKKKNIKEVVPYTGLAKLTKGCRIYAVIKGVADAGVQITFDAKIMPDERVLKGFHIANYAHVLSSKKPHDYEKQFSKTLSNKMTPEKFVEHFEEVKKRLSGEFA